MRKRILSLALAVVLAIALVPAAFAAQDINDYVGGDGWSVGYTITNVDTIVEEAPRNWHEEEEVYYSGAVKTYYCAAAPVTVFCNIEYRYWWGDTVTNLPTATSRVLEDGYEEYGTQLNQNGIYMFEIAEEDLFYVVVGGAASASNKAVLLTTDGLVSAIPPSPEVVFEDVLYTVAKGDGLDVIARKYGVSVEQIKADNKDYFDGLAAINEKNGTKIAVEAGVTLVIKTISKVLDLEYTVQKDETLWGIAYNYYGSMGGAAVNKIVAANKEYFDDLAARNKANKTNVALEAGAVLVLPGSGLRTPVSQGSLANAAGMYLVRPGDTLSSIAKVYYGSNIHWGKIYGANIDHVKLVNDSAMIYAGQWLVIPK